MALRDGLALLGTFVRPRWRTLLLGTLLGLAATGASLATPMATKWVLDSLGTSLDLGLPVALLTAFLIVGTVATVSQTFLLGRLAEHVVLDARRSLIRRFIGAKLEQAQRYRTGEVVTRVTSDTVLLREATSTSIVALVNSSVAMVGTIALMSVLDWQLLLTTLIALALIGGIVGVILPRIGKADRQAQDAIGALGSALEGRMRALRTVKASSAEARETGQVSALAEESTKHSIRSVWLGALLEATASSGVQLATLTILGLGAWRVGLGELSVSTLVAFLLYAFYIVEPIASLSQALSSIQSGLAAAARIREAEQLEQENVMARPAAAPAPVQDAPRLSLTDVTASYADAGHPAVRAVSLNIPRTGHIALVGPSGAGKTTVFSLLLRFIDPTSGTLALDGVPYRQLSLQDVRSRIAYVEQETPIIPGTVRDNLLLRYDDASDAEVWAALRTVRLEDTVRALPNGLDTQVAETNLSGGERQRIAVARALVRKNGILLLDEATAQLDGATEAAIHEAIRDAARTGTVVTIAHRLSTVLDADQIIVLDDGHVRASGTHAELLSRDELYREFIAALRIDA